MPFKGWLEDYVHAFVVPYLEIPNLCKVLIRAPADVVEVEEWGNAEPSE